MASAVISQQITIDPRVSLHLTFNQNGGLCKSMGIFFIYFLNHEATQVFICNTEHYVEI